MSVSITSASAPASTSKRYKTTKKKLTSVAKTVKPKAKATTTQKKLTSKAKTAQPKAKAPLSRPSWKDIIRVFSIQPYARICCLMVMYRNALRPRLRMLVKVFLGIPSKK